MLRCNEYIFAESLDEAYRLNQKKSAVIVGGNGWLKLGSRQWGSVIDISRLGLDKITETDDAFTIGAMVTLRDIEKHGGLNAYTDGAVREAVRHIVGTQFRNTVTVGGSIFGRFGFSDMLTVFMVMDSFIELYNGGVIPLHEFSEMPYDNDILVNMIVKKTPLKMAYSAFRNQQTDFPVLTFAHAFREDGAFSAVGARPSRAELRRDEEDILKDIFSLSPEDAEEAINAYALWLSSQYTYESNLRAGADYRRHIAEVLARRTVKAIVDRG